MNIKILILLLVACAGTNCRRSITITCGDCSNNCTNSACYTFTGDGYSGTFCGSLNGTSNCAINNSVVFDASICNRDGDADNC